MTPPLGKLEYLYVGTADFDRDCAYYATVLGAERVWAFHAFGARVAAFRVCQGPLLLLADHRPASSCMPVLAVADLNGQQVKLVKLQGEFVWHKHDGEDELFLVVQGRFRMEFRDRHVWLGEGEFLIVPRGVEHRPVADEEAHVLLFEPATTLNTGNVRNERTVAELDRI